LRTGGTPSGSEGLCAATTPLPGSPVKVVD
jgi:hypothetical protein